MSDSIEMSEDRRWLIESLKCPLRWNAACPEHELRLWLRFAWYAAALRNQIDNEVSFLISYDDFCPDFGVVCDLDDAEVKVNLERVLRWYPVVAREYLNRFARLFSMQAASRKIYGKHYVKKDIPSAAVRSMSMRSRGSLLRSTMSVELQRRLFWGALTELLVGLLLDIRALDAHSDPTAAENVMKALFDGPKLIFAVDFDRDVGASEGDMVQYAQFDVGLSSSQFHLYPIDTKAFKDARLKCRLQGWNYGLD